MFSPTELQELKIKLEAEKRRLEENLSDEGRRDPNDSARWDPAFPQLGDDQNASSSMMEESADEVEEFDRRIETEDTQNDRYQDVLRALAKMAAGTYGRCEVCSAGIPEARLRANPAARCDMEHAARRPE